MAVITGIDYKILSGKPHYNPEAIERLKDSEIVDELLTKFSAYIDEMIKLRNRLKFDLNFDFFEYSKIISKVHMDKANEIYIATYGKRILS